MNGVQEVIEALHVAAQPANSEFRAREVGGRGEALSCVDGRPAAAAANGRALRGAVVELKAVRLHAVEAKRAFGTVDFDADFILCSRRDF